MMDPSVQDGLEEGEVEGETLLIVESDSVDLSQDQSGDSLASDVDPDHGPDQDLDQDMGFCCERCHKWTTTAQLRGDPPSFLKGDNFFKLICSECSEDGKESFERMRLTWQQVVMLAMYNLSLEGTGRQGYFRWKEDICAFIGRHWNFLLGTRKKTSTWWSTVAGCLSVGSPTFFRSGAQEFGEPGWWKLVQNRPPTLRPEPDKSTSKAKVVKPCLDPTITVEGLRKRGAKNPVEKAMQLKEKRCRTQEAKDIRRAQRDRATTPKPNRTGSKLLVLEKGEVMDFSSMSSSDRTPLTSPSPSPSLLSEADMIPDAMPPQALFHDDEELEPEAVIDPGMEYVPPCSALIGRKKPRPPQAAQIKREVESEDEDCDKALPHCGSNVNDRRKQTDQSEPASGASGGGATRGPRCLSIGPYEERLLLRRLEACPLALAVTASAKRLRRKLLVRQEKRNRGLPLLDVDRAVSGALSLVGGVYGAQVGGVYSTLMGMTSAGGGVTTKYRSSGSETRILDRFQSPVCGRRSLQLSSVSFFHRLMGSDSGLDQSLKSPYTSRLLKPYIRRDYESRPLKMRLLAEIRAYPHRKNPNWTPEPHAPIDYCYVRPSHIPSVNAMCHDGFWPGVDLEESLQYPDFTVVALYKKVVVGFGFMVPDVKYNEAYISFLLVHPEWRRAGIGTFMIYHLIQTCMGKDVTLHVSASNPAMLLYQKFGFKAEEYILDFYDKYYPVDSKECRHAFFLRLRR